MSKTPDEVKAMVASSHGDIDYVRTALAADPTLAKAVWDWGDGDWESAFGAAGHMGRRDIAELLLAYGAHLDVFVAAMLGEVDVVAAMLASQPDLRHAKGPHGIPLLSHAEAGGEAARPVVELLTRA
jgi:hypothetical protein